MAADAPLSIRRAQSDDLAACGRIWRDSLNDYLGRLRQPPIPDELGGLRRLHEHALRTDPARFLVAVRGDEDGEGPGRVVAFASALDRGPLWYLSMLFVDPPEQGAKLGARLLDLLLPPPAARDNRFLAIAADSAQPISNALYASRGVPPRVTLYNLAGHADHGSALPPLAPEIRRQPLPAASDALPADLHALDREVLGFDRPADHAFAISTGRLPFAYRFADGRLAGYGYAAPAGNVGPVAVRDSAHLADITADLIRAVPPRGASSAWIPGPAGETFTMLVRAGLRIEGFPVLLLWDRPLLDLDRYLPLSPGLP